MAKGQMRSNKEAKKPKAEKVKAAPGGGAPQAFKASTDKLNKANEKKK